MKKTFRIFILAIALLAVKPASAIVITFDDLHGSGYLPSNYAGLNWGPAWQYFDTVQAPYTASSGSERIYSYSYGGFIDFGKQVVFQGSWLASANVGQQMWWEGYQKGVKIFESQHYLGGSALFINLNWTGVDSVRLMDTADNHFVLDDISYEPIGPVPDAACSLILLGIAVIPLLLLTQRFRSAAREDKAQPLGA